MPGIEPLSSGANFRRAETFWETCASLNAGLNCEHGVETPQ